MEFLSGVRVQLHGYRTGLEHNVLGTFRYRVKTADPFFEILSPPCRSISIADIILPSKSTAAADARFVWDSSDVLVSRFLPFVEICECTCKEHFVACGSAWN